MNAWRRLLLVCLPIALSRPAAAAPAAGPSRPAVKGCVWEKLSDTRLGLQAWVQRCDFGFRKIDLFVEGDSLFVRYSDGGAPEPVVDVFDLKGGETPEAGMRRVFAERTPKAVADRCVLAPARENKPPRGKKRFTFVPNPAYDRELSAKANPDEVPDPPCGDWGTAPDGIQYFEVQSRAARKFLFVRVGQDEPLFDEQNLDFFVPR